MTTGTAIADTSTDAGLDSRVAAFLGREAGLLDARRWHEWVALFAEEGMLWAPAWNGDDGFTDDPTRQISLIRADVTELKARIFRIEGDDSYASVPLPHTVHLVTPTGVERTSSGTLTVRANWLVHCFWRTQGAVMRAGRYEYELRAEPGGFSILMKKVFVHDDRVMAAIDIYSI